MLDYNVTVLDLTFHMTAIIDGYESLIWRELHNGIGDMELHIPLTDVSILKTLVIGHYLMIRESDNLMIIESVNTIITSKGTSKTIVKGRSLESLLDYRIIWDQTILDGNLQNGIERLLNENAIKPKANYRKIPGLSMKRVSGDISKLKVDLQATGNNLGETIRHLCDLNDIGYRIRPDMDRGVFIFQLVKGTDRSYSQDENSYVLFSHRFDNLASSEIIFDTSYHRTVALIAGQGEGRDRVRSVVGKVNSSGFNRREMYVDARDIAKTDEDGEDIPLSVYKQHLESRGKEKLLDYPIRDEASGVANMTNSFLLGRDFEMGDIIQFENEIGVEFPAVVSGILLSVERGHSLLLPEFEVVNEDKTGGDIL